ncbi:hypothetical protein F5880DRAFT_1614701 [Lentinula raphanica]|nr:hypothetical protein F5880DRAFT_1614701 [Lentinula raphanica]
MDRILAPEILDHIVDQLRNDKRSLLAAGSSCKGMLFRSRYHLFHTLEITLFTSPNGWGQGRNATDPRSVSSLLRILDTPYSSMGHAVHRLIVNFGFHFPQTLPTDFSRIQQNLPNVKTLHWRDDTWCDVPYAFKSLVFGLDIETFDISGVWFQDASELVQMIAMWPSTLQKIVMGSIVCSGDNTDTKSVNHTLAKRKSIHFHTLHSASTWAAQNLFRSMISSSMITIDRFIIGMRFPDEEEMMWVNGLLSKYGPSFSEVTHQLPVPVEIEIRNYDLPVFDLQHCTNLRVLNIQSVYLGSPMSSFHEPIPLATSAVQRIISSVPHPESLDEIKIRFEVDLSEWSGATAFSTVADRTASLSLSSNDSTAPSTDYVPFIDQFARFDWTDFAQFLLGIPFSLKPNSYPSSLSSSQSNIRYPGSFLSSLSKHTSLSASRPKGSSERRIHVQIGVYPSENKAAREVFAKEYDRYVEYIYSNGLKNIVDREGLEFVFSQVEYGNLYEVM